MLKNIEDEAKRIYNGWTQIDGWVPWVDGGNSLQQDKARAEARRLNPNLPGDIRPGDIADPVAHALTQANGQIVSVRTKHFRAAVRSRKPAIKEMAARFLSDGLSEDAAIREIVEIVDNGIDWVAIGSAVGPVGAVVGAILESADGPVAIAIVGPMVKAVNRARAKA